MRIDLYWAVCTPKALCRSRLYKQLVQFSETRIFPEIIWHPSEEMSAIKVPRNLIVILF